MRMKSCMGAHTLQNFGKGTENQDCYLASGAGNKCLAAVFDGHGEKGGRISEFARINLSKNLFSHKELHSDPRAALESAYKDTQSQIVRDHGPAAAQSGTTAVACYQHHDRLLIANVGDSRAVLGRCDTARKGGLKAVELTSDQKPSRADEKQRILGMGGKVDQLTFPVWNQNGSVRLMRGGPERVMDASGFGGLAMSRSFGDLSLRPFVSSLPEVSERKLDSKDRFLVLGSDGVWDQMSSQEAVDIASRVADPVHAAREITNQCRRRWASETEGLLSDDITAVVVRLDHGGNAASTSAARQDNNTAAAASTAIPSHARTSQNFFRSQPERGSGAMTPQPQGRDRRDGGLPGDRRDGGQSRDRDRLSRTDPNPLRQTIGSTGGGRRDLLFPNVGPSGLGNSSEGNRRPGGLGHSRSEPHLTTKGHRQSRNGHSEGGRRNDLLPAAGR